MLLSRLPLRRIAFWPFFVRLAITAVMPFRCDQNFQPTGLSHIGLDSTWTGRASWGSSTSHPTVSATVDCRLEKFGRGGCRRPGDGGGRRGHHRYRRRKHASGSRGGAGAAGRGTGPRHARHPSPGCRRVLRVGGYAQRGDNARGARGGRQNRQRCHGVGLRPAGSTSGRGLGLPGGADAHAGFVRDDERPRPIMATSPPKYETNCWPGSGRRFRPASAVNRSPSIPGSASPSRRRIRSPRCGGCQSSPALATRWWSGLHARASSVPLRGSRTRDGGWAARWRRRCSRSREARQSCAYMTSGRRYRR